VLNSSKRVRRAGSVEQQHADNCATRRSAAITLPLGIVSLVTMTTVVRWILLLDAML
jgi:hypothetical protein